MKRRSYFLLALFSAALTIGVLAATVGKRHGARSAACFWGGEKSQPAEVNMPLEQQ